MIKYITTHMNGKYVAKPIKWTTEEYYNHIDVHNSYAGAMDYVDEVNEVVRQVNNKMRKRGSKC